MPADQRLLRSATCRTKAGRLGVTCVLGVKKKCGYLARYLAACLRLADRACGVLSAEGKPLPIERLATRLCAAPDALGDVLRCDYRFRTGSGGDTSLLLWDRMDEARKSPVLALAYRSLYWRGLPQRISVLTEEIVRWHGGSLSERALTAPLERSPHFVERGGKWMLREWFEPRLQFEPSFALLTMRQSRDQGISEGDLSQSAIVVLGDVACVLPFERLWWELGRLSRTALSASDRLRLETALFNTQAVTWLRNGQLAASPWLNEALEWFGDLSVAHRNQLRRQLLETYHEHLSDSDPFSQWLSKAKLKSTERALRYLHSVAPAAAPQAEVFEHALAPDDIEAQVGLADPEWAEGEDGKALISRLVRQAEDDLRVSLIGEGVLVLANGELILVPGEAGKKLADGLATAVTGVSGEDLIQRLWPTQARPPVEAARIVDYLTELGLGVSDGYWHAARPVLRRLLRPAAKSIRDALAEANGPQDLGKLMASVAAVSPDCPGPVRRIAHEILTDYLARSARTWQLECGKWWCRPEDLATHSRLGRLRLSEAVQSDGDLLASLIEQLGLALEELTETELQDVVRAFTPKQRASVPVLPPSPVPALPEPERPAPPENLGQVPPKRSAVTLDMRMLRSRSLRFTRGARRIFRSCLGQGRSDKRMAQILVEGIYRVDVELDSQGERLRSDGLFEWLNLQGAAPGDRVVIYAPAPGVSTPHVSHEAAPQKSEAKATGGHVRLHLRERLVSALQATECVLSVEDMVLQIQAGEGVTAGKASVASTLSSNTHLFAQWGSGLWGMREWQGNWTNRVPLHLLAWRIEEEDLVVSILESEGRAVTLSELAAEIAARFAVRVEAVHKVSFVRRSDRRIYWPEGSNYVMLMRWLLPQMDLLRTSWRYLVAHPAAMARVTRWFVARWGRPLGTTVRELGLDAEVEER